MKELLHANQQQERSSMHCGVVIEVQDLMPGLLSAARAWLMLQIHRSLPCSALVTSAKYMQVVLQQIPHKHTAAGGFVQRRGTAMSIGKAHGD